MKKTLTALCFALCATFAIAQTNHKAVKLQTAQNQMVQKADVKVMQSSYKGSLFTKAAGDVLASEDFATEPATGVLTASDQISGHPVGSDTAHTQTGYASRWHRWTDTTVAYLETMATQYPGFAGQYYSGSDFPMRSATPTNGYMFLSMIEYISTPTVGGYNAWFALPSISTTGAPLVDITFYQNYRKFNNDQCWIDYSLDGTTWTAFEINVKGIDVQVNGMRRGYTTITLPTAIVNQANVNLRMRWSCQQDGYRGGTYGYYWAVDDVQFVEAPADRFRAVSNEYFEGFYQMMPQGLNVPMVWNAEFKNTGVNTQTNVTGTINTMASMTTPSQVAVSVAAARKANNAFTDASTLAANESAVACIDPFGYYAYNGFGYCDYNPSVNQPTHGTVACLPTATTGRHFWFVDVNSTALQHIADSITFDTIGYDVNAIDPAHNNAAIWGRDNGVLSKYSYWIYGMTGANTNTFSDRPDDVPGWDEANYSVLNSYVTGDNVPANWRIKGVELVTSTYGDGLAEAGVSISSLLIRDSVGLSDNGQDNSLYFKTPETGASDYVVQESDLNDTTNMQYKLNGTYNTIRIEFPEQPVLMPKTAYHIGYSLNEPGYFSVAESRNFYYDLENVGHYYGSTPGMEEYDGIVNPTNYYNTLIYDPTVSSWNIFRVSSYPMIRMLVGPYQHMPKTLVNFECDGETGMIYDLNYNELCGHSDSVTTGANKTFYFIPSEGYIVDQIFENGEVVFTNDENDEENFMDADGGALTFTIGADETTIRCTFKEYEEGIDLAANVSMNLQPNPATSNVQLTINGVEGMVDFALIDMSGRVIRSNQINAEVAQNINLNGLAKGAYFVRITNNNFSKVEKLIVR